MSSIYFNTIYKVSSVILLSVMANNQLYAQSPVIYSNSQETVLIGNHVSILKDVNSDLTAADAASSSNFIPFSQKVPNLGISKATFWIKFEIANKSGAGGLFLNLENPLINDAELYSVDNHKVILLDQLGNNFKFNDRKYKSTSLLFKINVPYNETGTFLLKIKSNGPMVLPLSIGSYQKVWEYLSKNEGLFGIYVGIIFALLAYNLFLFLSIREKSYILYVLYLLFICLTQISLLGYPFKYFWPDYPYFEKLSIILFPSLGGSFALLFTKSFLDIKHYIPKIDSLFKILIIIYGVAVLCKILKYDNLSYKIIDFNGSIGSILVLISAIAVTVKGLKHAKYFLIAWIILIIGVLLYSFQNIGLFPYSPFTKYTMYLGTCAEAILLSFALADKINVYKKEKEDSQAKALQASLEKEQFVREQNIILESKVRERTGKLAQSNRDLTLAMSNLKKAESQLVHAEKMASLGQLTAGIAHEINNPINFVKSNIRPLKLDIRDLTELIKKYRQINRENLEEKLKEIEDFNEEIEWDALNEEITSLLNGIEEGSVRTADIVRGLRTFSRLDEDELKEADIHAGMDATLTLLKNMMPTQLIVAREYGDIPLIECYAGKLNQVFMNILTNSIQAVNAKPILENEKITITTKAENNTVVISIADTGIGIPEAIKDKIFDPFFTTKDVGEGTGLGLSMTFSIIQNHHGHIEVHSEEGKGSEFVITIPVKQVVEV